MLKSISFVFPLLLFKKNDILNSSESQVSAARHAICILYPSSLDSNVQGLVSFSQQNISSPTQIVATIKGLNPNQLHGFHIHEFGDLTKGCDTAGPHYNPYNKKQGGPLDSERHVGDLGNIKSDGQGNGYLAISDNLIKLFGENSVLGRSCVVHRDEDDLGRGGQADSMTTGHAGPRVACGTIGLSSSFKNLAPSQ
uniref:Superoxide dismutase [Cu-Zn] n=1 Tax=Cryptocaryon irritans TaxID=153251 RepID=K9K2G1_9CILI|nr:superoxidase dismutase [Cryptocaryon irritans]